MQINNSNRLSFHLMTSEDAELLFELNKDPAVMKYINGGKPINMGGIRQIDVPRMLSYRNEREGWGLWKVTVCESDSFIGWILVRPMGFFSKSPEFDNIELGWRFKQDSWGKGYGAEAALAVKEALIANALATNTTINKLSAIAVENNIGSINIMKKLGMRYLKTGLHRDPLGDAEVVYYELEI